MFKNYLKIAWRNLFRNKLYSGINIVGLSIGMAMALLIGLWIWDEFNINKNFSNHDQVARVLMNSTKNGQTVTLYDMPYPLAGDLRAKYTDGLKITAMMWKYSGGGMYAYKNKKVYIEGGKYAEPGMIKILPLKMIRGDEKALNEPASIIIDHFMAITIFGKEDPLNKIIIADNSHSFKVTGVFEDFPKNSAFPGLHAMVSWSEMLAEFPEAKQVMDKWDINVVEVYTLVTDMANMEKTSVKINSVLSGHGRTDHPELLLYPMNRWHLYAEFTNGKNAGGRIVFVWLFGIIGVFVLLLACINFMNLSTARSEKRSREVGIRKSVGSLRLQLIFQFYIESLVVSFFAFVLSLMLVQLVLPFFNDVSGKKMSILWSSPLFWMSGIVFSFITGLIAGSYPALYLSSFNPVKVLKGVFRAGRLAAIPRRVLVVVQFTVSIVLIIGTIVVFRQIQFAKDRPIGYSRDGLITLEMSTPDIHKHFDVVKNELINSGAIVSIAEAGSPPTAVWSTNAGFDWKGKDPTLAVDFPNIDVSYDYGKTVGWQFKDGRDFSREFLTDSAAFVMNETAATFIGMKNPVGEILKWDGQPYKIIGIIKDMVVESPYAPVRPTLFHLSKDAGNVIIAKINPGTNAHTALSTIETVFKKYNPSQPFDYSFVDEDYAKKFGDEQRTGKLAGFFALLAIFISCLGLFGMASFVAEQRTKEIGVSKILGASVFNLWGLLSKDFVLLVILSCAVAIPVAYYFLHNWLLNYEYRTEITWWIFATACSGALIITLLTVSFQSIKAAVANPVKSLRTE